MSARSAKLVGSTSTTARKEMEQSLGAKIATKVVENVPEGADVVTHHTDSTAVMRAAEEKGKYAVAYHSDMKKLGPKAQIAAVTHHWGKYYTQQAQAVIDREWKTSATWGGIKDGFVKLEGYGAAVPNDVKNCVQAKEKEIVAGTLIPFDGPIKDNDGKVRLEKDHMSDADLSKMNYFVEGVAGKLPNSQSVNRLWYGWQCGGFDTRHGHHGGIAQYMLAAQTLLWQIGQDLRQLKWCASRN